MLKNTDDQSIPLFRLAILAALVLIFITVATQKIWALRAAAERVGVEFLLGTVRSALGIELTVNVTRSEGRRELASYHGQNPILLLEPLPANYLGEFDTQPAEPTEGAWYFNREQGTLNYRVRFLDFVQNSDFRDPALLRFRVQVAYKDENDNGSLDEGESVNSIRLRSLSDYRWLDTDEFTGGK